MSDSGEYTITVAGTTYNPKAFEPAVLDGHTSFLAGRGGVRGVGGLGGGGGALRLHGGGGGGPGGDSGGGISLYPILKEILQNMGLLSGMSEMDIDIVSALDVGIPSRRKSPRGGGGGAQSPASSVSSAGAGGSSDFQIMTEVQDVMRAKRLGAFPGDQALAVARLCMRQNVRAACHQGTVVGVCVCVCVCVCVLMDNP